MNPEKQRIAIALACGWKIHENPQDNSGHMYSAPVGTSPFLGRHALPNYLEDLNAIHEVEKFISEKYRFLYETILHSLNLKYGLGISVWETIHATAAQRAEAFLRTIDKWEE